VTEKVVTPYSSYIVLEKVEDYIKYNIAPPKDLEEECERLHYVKKDTRSYRQTLKEQDEFDVLNNVVHSYNFKIKQWDKNSDTIQFSREKYQNLRAINFPQEITNENSSNQLTGKVSGLSIGTPGSSAALNEVVVVGYGTALKKNLTGSVSYFRGNQIVPGLSIEENIAGRVSGVSVQSSGDYFTGQSSITIRGVSSIKNNNPLFIIDGIPVHGNPNNYINTNDIESITVLKDAASTAIYGNGGANGVIVINSKKGRNVGYYNYNQKPYRLKEREDVDYMQDLKLTSKSLLPFAYGQLRIEHTSEPGFYLDVAQYFFEVGLKQQAMSILLNGAEASDANSTTLKAIGYILEAWKKFADAIKIYEQLLSSNPNDVYIYRDLAWAYYQNGNYQEAVEILYKAIKLDLVYQEYQYKSIKAILLNDMNAIYRFKKTK
jgi:TonB-dependent SusC/RagA subfamily outer membrane receptor